MPPGGAGRHRGEKRRTGRRRRCSGQIARRAPGEWRYNLSKQQDTTKDSAMRLPKRGLLWGLGIVALTALPIRAEEPENRSIKCRRGGNIGNHTMPGAAA